MSDAILMHDAGVSAFDGAGGVVTDSDDDISFNWDEQHIVTVDAPADLERAFDTERFYKIEGATVARPIKQPYLVGDDVETYVKPADELRRAAWSFDNVPFTIRHPDSGMVKNIDDIHGFWRNARYDDDAEALKEDLYIPVTDEEAISFIEDNTDVSVGFYNRIASAYDGDVGGLIETDGLDGYQVDMYGNHIAGVEHGRCSGEDGCGLDSGHHGTIIRDMTDSATDNDDDNCNCNTNMTDNDNDNFDIPDLSVDAIADKNDSVSELKEERDSLRSDIDEMESTIDEFESDVMDALDSMENVTVELEEDECVCEGVKALAETADKAAEKAEKVEDLQDELQEYREEEREEALDALEDLGADREKYADESLDALEEEIERREEVLDEAGANVSVKNADDGTNESTDSTDKKSMSGTRTFGRGHKA